MKFHPLANMVPPMTDEEFESLCKGIRTVGLLEPITLYEGKILDGRHRYKACKSLNIEPRYVPYSGDLPAQFVLQQTNRRSLSAAQKSAIAVEMEPLIADEIKARENHRKSNGATKSTRLNLAESPNDRTAAGIAAKSAGASRASVVGLKKVRRIAPELYEEVKAGKLSTHKAGKAAKVKETKPKVYQDYRDGKISIDEAIAEPVEPPQEGWKCKVCDTPTTDELCDVCEYLTGRNNKPLHKWCRLVAERTFDPSRMVEAIATAKHGERAELQIEYILLQIELFASAYRAECRDKFPRRYAVVMQSLLNAETLFESLKEKM